MRTRGINYFIFIIIFIITTILFFSSKDLSQKKIRHDMKYLICAQELHR